MNNEVIKFKETVLNKENINALKQMFENETLYIEYMNTLYALRKGAFETLEIMGLTLETTKHPNYAVFNVLNKLIDALLQDDYSWDSNGNFKKRNNINTIQNEKKKITFQCEY